jgi:Zn-dependent protease
MIVAAAGPVSNLAIAALAAVVGRILFAIEPQTVEVFGRIILINAVLAVFNLLPVPPLDGSHIMRFATGMRDETYLMLSRWGFVILLAIIFVPALNKVLATLIGIALVPFVLIFPEARYGFQW